MSAIFDYENMTDEELRTKASEIADTLSELGKEFRNTSEFAYVDLGGIMVRTREFLNDAIMVCYVDQAALEMELERRNGLTNLPN